MKKIIPTLLTAAGCMTCMTFTAFTTLPTFAAGAIGNAVDGVVDAGEDIADGIFRAGDDIADNLAGNGTSDLTTPDNPSGSVNSDISDNSDIINSSSSGSNAIGDRNDISQSAPSAQNPTTGVTMGYAGATAVIAAMGVVVSSIHRKRS